MTLNLQRFGAVLAGLMWLFLSSVGAQQTAPPASNVPTDKFTREVTTFLGRELAFHVADVHQLDPPQGLVLNAQTTGEFTWGAYTRAIASYSALSGDKTIAGKDIPKYIGQLGLIEAKQGGKAFAQLYAALSLRHFGTDLAKNPVW